MEAKVRIAKLLAQGVAPVVVAKTVGVTESYLSQLSRTDEEFQALLTEEVEAQKGELQSKEEIPKDGGAVYSNEELANKHRLVEATILAQVQEAVSATADLSDLIKALKTVGELGIARDKLATPAPASTTNNQTVNYIQLTVPEALGVEKPVVDVTPNNEIIAVNGLELRPLSGEGVKDVMAQLRSKYEEKKNEMLRPARSLQEELSDI